MANDRVSQLPVEAVIAPTSATGRTSQLPVEVVASPTSGKARTSQQSTEVVISRNHAAGFPEVASQVASFYDSTDHNYLDVTMPSGVQSGDRLLMFVSTGYGSGVTTPTGWTRVLQATAQSGQDDYCFDRVADGTEGSAVRVSFGGFTRSVAIAMRITGSATAIAPEFSTAFHSTTTAWNCNSLSPAAGAKNYLWIQLLGCDYNYSPATVVPSTTDGDSFGQYVRAAAEVGASDRPTLMTFTLLKNDSNIDPSSINTNEGNRHLDAWLIAVTPQANRVSQLPVEALVQPTTATARTSSVSVEAIALPTTASARLSQLVVETLVQPGSIKSGTGIIGP